MKEINVWWISTYILRYIKSFFSNTQFINIAFFKISILYANMFYTVDSCSSDIFKLIINYYD